MPKQFKKYKNALFRAVLENNVKSFREIVETRLSAKDAKQAILQTDEEGFLPLHVAAGLNHSAIVEVLLRVHDKENINICVGGYSALHLAAAKGYDRIVYLLCKQSGCDVNLLNAEGDTALICASRLGHTAAVNVLVEHNADVNKRSTLDGESPLFAASESGKFLVVKRLLMLLPKLKLEAANNESATSLLVAAQNGHMQCVQELVKVGADVNRSKNDGATALFMAAQEGHMNVVELLLTIPNIEIDKQNTYKTTPLLIACLKEHSEIVQVLLDTGRANPNHKEVGNVTAGMVAAELGNIKILRVLLKHKCDLEDMYRNDHRNAFQVAIISNQLEAVKFMLQYVYHDFEYYDKQRKKKLVKEKFVAADGNSILMDSIQYGSIDICERIVEHFQLDVDECNTKTGEYPMTLAAEQNKIDIVSFLLKHTKNINIKRKKSGSAPLLIACSKGNAKLVNFLLSLNDSSDSTNITRSHVLDVNVRDLQGITPLIEAARKRQPEIVKSLLEHSECDVNCCSNIGLTPLFCAVQMEDSYSVSLLLSSNAKIIPKKSRTNCLHVACEKGYLNIIKLLLEKHSVGNHGKNPNSHEFCERINDQDRNGNTPLHLAVSQNRKRVIQEILRSDLIDEGVIDFLCVNRDGHTLLSLAASNGMQKIIELLVESGASILEAESVGRSPKQEALNSGSSNLGQYLDNLKSSSLAKLQRQTQSNDLKNNTSSKYVHYHQGDDFNVSSFNGVHGSLRNRDTTSCILL